MEEDRQFFWSQIIPPQTTVYLECNDDCSLKITNACLSEIPPDFPQTSIKLKAHIKTPIDFHEEADEIDADIQEVDVFIASLIPYEQEQETLGIIFSPLNIVQFTNLGALPIHLSGYEIPILDDFMDSEEEEENNESKTKDEEEFDKKITEKLSNSIVQSSLGPDEIQSRFKNMISKQLPPPPKVHHSKKDKKGQNQHNKE